jgi:transcriptional regulator with XRE-family HTH domain
MLARHVGKVVRERRKEQGMTLRELAKRCGYSKTYVGEIEQGIKKPTLTALEAVALALGTTVAEVVDLGERQKAIAGMTPEERLARIAELCRA